MVVLAPLRDGCPQKSVWGGDVVYAGFTSFLQRVQRRPG